MLHRRLIVCVVYMKGEDNYDEVTPWTELLEKGTFSTATLSRLPLSYQTTDAWVQLISDSAEASGMTWLHALHLGIAQAERGNIDEPVDLFARSTANKRNPIALRCLAVLSKDYKTAWGWYLQVLSKS